MPLFKIMILKFIQSIKSFHNFIDDFHFFAEESIPEI